MSDGNDRFLEGMRVGEEECLKRIREGAPERVAAVIRKELGASFLDAWVPPLVGRIVDAMVGVKP